LVVALGATFLGYFLRISAIEWLVLMAAIALVLCAEALNTAIERAVDLLKPEWHSMARDAKDMAAAGVLIASLFSLIAGVMLFGPRLLRVLFK
jgi:diacylglycerol kinase